MIAFPRNGGVTWQTFRIFDDTRTGGVGGILIDGVDHFSGDTLATGETDYTGSVTATGLSRGVHTFQATLDGATSGDVVDFKTMPDVGEDYDFLMCGDIYQNGDYGIGKLLARENHLDIALMILSEEFYPDGDELGGDGATTLYTDGTSDNLPTVDNNDEYLLRLNKYVFGNAPVGINVKYRDGLGIDTTLGIRRTTNMKAMNRKYRVWSIPDNHEMALVGSSNSQPGQVKYDSMLRGYWNYQGDFPQTADTDVDSEPALVLLYWDKVVGDVHFITLDTQSYNDKTENRALDADVTGETTIGENKQNAWFRRTVTNSTSDYIVVCAAGGPILNSVASFTTEWQGSGGLFEFLDGINKTILFFAWDLHTYHARLITEDASANAGILDINSGPLWTTEHAGSYVDQYGTATSEIVYANFAEHATTVNTTATAGAGSIILNGDMGWRDPEDLTKAIIITPDSGELVREAVSGKTDNGDGTFTFTLTDGSLQRTASAGNRVQFGQATNQIDMLENPPMGKANYLRVSVRREYIEVKVVQTGYGRILGRYRVYKGERKPSLFKKTAISVGIGE